LPYYRDWLPIVVAGVTLAALHLASVPMQRAGLPLSLFPAGGGSGIVLAHLACLLAATVVLAVMAARMRRQLLCLGSEPRRLAALAAGLAAGQPLPAQVAAEQFPPGSVADALATMSGQLVERLAHDREADREHLRIRAALDSVTTTAIIADAERTTVYANRSLMETLRQAEANIRRDLPHFDVAGLIGGSTDAFHRNPAHQSRLLAGLKGTHTAQIQVGGHVMRLTVNQVRDGDGQLVGYVVEWLDRTEEVRIEQEVARVVEAAAAGDLSGRLELDGKRDFTLSLSHSLNALLDNFARSAARLSEVLQALARGDLTVRMEGEVHGVFARMRDDANATVDQLASIVSRIRDASAAINTASTEIASGNSDLSRRTEQQAANLEETAASMEELTSTVRQNADHARQANQLAIGAADVASQGGEVVGQ